MITVEPTLPSAPAPMGPLIEASFRTWIANLRACAGLLIAPALLGLLPALWMPQPDDPLQAMEQLGEWFLRPSVWLLYLLLMAVNLVCVNAALYRMGMRGRGQDPGLQASISRGLERLPAAFASALLYTLLLTLSLLPWIGSLAMLGQAAGNTALLALGGLLGLVLLALPTWLSLAAGLFLYAVVLERRGPIAALQRSFQLVHGHWWRSSVVIGVALTVYLTAAMVAALFAGMIAAGVALALHGMQALQGSQWLFGMQLLLAPVSALLQLLMYAGGLAMFSDLVYRKP